MDTSAVLLGLAERDRWTRRTQTLERELARTRRKLQMAERRRRRLDKELARLSELSSAMADAHFGGDNERTPPLPTLR